MHASGFKFGIERHLLVFWSFISKIPKYYYWDLLIFPIFEICLLTHLVSREGFVQGFFFIFVANSLDSFIQTCSCGFLCALPAVGWHGWGGGVILMESLFWDSFSPLFRFVSASFYFPSDKGFDGVRRLFLFVALRWEKIIYWCNLIASAALN